MQNEDQFKCKLCKNAYSYEGTLRTHVMIEHCKNNSYFCDQCEYHNSTQSNISNKNDQAILDTNHKEVDANNLRRLLKTHSAAKPNTCNQSDFASVRAEDLRTHLETHAGDKSYKCNQCNFVSVRADSLRTHLKIHSREKSYKCNQCDYASVRAGHLRTHLKTHTGEKTYKCNQCDYAFENTQWRKVKEIQPM